MHGCTALPQVLTFGGLQKTMSTTSSPAESTPVSVPAETTVVPVRPAVDKVSGEKPAPDPTRYGDWEKNGRCIDF
jgi:hypothetical protein